MISKRNGTSDKMQGNPEINKFTITSRSWEGTGYSQRSSRDIAIHNFGGAGHCKIYNIWKGFAAKVHAFAHTWLRLVASGYAWLRLDTAGYAWLRLVMPGYTGLCLILPGYAWLCLVAPGYAWLRLVTPGFNWLSLVTPGYARLLPITLNYAG